ncbi:hypothetical protein HAZT_HAZT011882 [Hyalella azteca]|uniref:CSD domain-containing protein n=1 Tax=Hyalella azteca TaxID=294128 RepID=A0A6A0HA99_HYAAZ|nr:hypothetical protein HAZT_HAZT011882 [Hyalella azteca]
MVDTTSRLKREQQQDACREREPDIANLSIAEENFVSSYNEATHGPLKRGKVKWFNVAKGWGFITPNDGSPDVFVHQSTIQMPGFRRLCENEEVEFTVREGKRGLETTLVQGLEGAKCLGSQTEPSTSFRPRRRKCYNCQNFRHFARDCSESRQPKRCRAPLQCRRPSRHRLSFAPGKCCPFQRQQ